MAAFGAVTRCVRGAQRASRGRSAPGRAALYLSARRARRARKKLCPARDIIARFCDARLVNGLEHHYRGGKGRSFREIVNLMPPHARYIETHLGGGAVLRHKRPAAETIGIEIDERVVARWRGSPIDGVTVLHGDCLEVLPRLKPRPEDLIYSDPPYPAATRRWPRCYRHDYTDEQHHALLDTLRGLPCAIIVSGYRNALYDDRLADWHRTDYLATTRAAPVVESAWTNYAPGLPLHDYTYAGRDFRERETLRRRRQGIVRSLQRADAVSLHAALADLADTHPAAILATARRIDR